MKKYFLSFIIVLFSYAAHANNEKILKTLEMMQEEASQIHQVQNIEDIKKQLPSFSDENIDFFKDLQFSENLFFDPTKADKLIFTAIEEILSIFQQRILKDASATDQNSLEIKLWISFTLLKLVHAQVAPLHIAFEDFPKDDPSYETRRQGMNQTRSGIGSMISGHILTLRGASSFNSPFILKNKKEFIAHIPQLINLYDKESWQSLIAQIKQGFLDYPQFQGDKYYDEMLELVNELNILGQQKFGY